MENLKLITLGNERSNNEHVRSQPDDSLFEPPGTFCLRCDDVIRSFLFIFRQAPRVAFTDINATELRPCVMFYSNKAGEKVRRICSSR